MHQMKYAAGDIRQSFKEPEIWVNNTKNDLIFWDIG